MSSCRPTRVTRRFIRRLSDECRLPVYCFTDCDPYGFANIYRTLKVGSGNAAHISPLFCVPHARFLGVTPRDLSVIFQMLKEAGALHATLELK